ncbi:SMC-Scp complex subunit ScpB [Acetobacteraceae bacterium]|nr:SMC-Scp complex subunit ScpB [Candidatus Parcubacteria bacterium]
MNNDLKNKIEALLFGLGRPLSHAELAEMLEVSVEEIQAAAGEAGEGGIVIVDDGKILELRATASAAQAIEKARKEEMSRDIGRAGLEVLSAVLYRGPLSRSEIDFIRGVNSSQILRTLTMRGLLRRIPNPKDERSFLYEPTTDLLAQLGVTSLTELPEYATMRHELEKLEAAYKEKESASQS